jgi:hypothetical protein
MGADPHLGVFTFLHIGAQQSVDAGLIAWSLFSVPFEYIAVYPNGELLLPGNRL